MQMKGRSSVDRQEAYKCPSGITFLDEQTDTRRHGPLPLCTCPLSFFSAPDRLALWKFWFAPLPCRHFAQPDPLSGLARLARSASFTALAVGSATCLARALTAHPGGLGLDSCGVTNTLDSKSYRSGRGKRGL